MPRRLLPRLGLVILSFGAVVAGTVAALGMPLGMLGRVGTGEPAPISLSRLEQRSLVYAADGSVMASLRGEHNRQPVELADVPRHVVDAILAVEDTGFYSHDGINGRALVRALSANLGEGAITQGGSTITQQLVKLSLLSREQTLERKVQEIVLALRLEKQMTKDEILSRYLNMVYFGNHAYGVQAAAETYFGVPVQMLDKGQAALLAALIRNPVFYNPIRYPDRAKERRKLALERMERLDMLAEEEVLWFDATSVPTQIHEVVPEPRDYFVETVKQRLLDDERLGATRQEREQAVFQGGLRIYTTFDPRAQQLALQARDSQLPGQGGVFPIGNDPQTGEPRQATAAIVTVEQGTGAVRAMVGGPGFNHYKYNLAVQNPRQGGSSHKAFVLATLMEQGRSPNDIVDGTGPCRFRQPQSSREPWYEVENFDGSGGQVGTITQQTLKSSNCAYVRLGKIAGIPNVIDTARRLGVTGNLDAFDSFPLGAEEVTPLEMAGAYAAIANDGTYNAPYLVDRVEDSSGRVIFQHQAAPRPGISQQAARNTTHILQQNVQSGTGTAARLSGRPAAGKTGTATNSADAWFVGYSGQYTTAVWVGGMGGQIPISGLTGGSYPARIWGAYMNPLHNGMPVAGFQAPDPRGGGQFLRPPADFDPEGSSGTTTTTTPPLPPGNPGPTPPTFTLPTLPVVTDPPGGGGGGGNGGGGGGGDDGVTTLSTVATIPTMSTGTSPSRVRRR